MNVFDDPRTLTLIGTVLSLLGISWFIVWILKRRPEGGVDPAILETFRLRVRAWSILFATLAATFLLYTWVTVAIFGLLSFWALREFITITPTRPGDHRPLFCVLFLVTPLQFILVYLGWYDLYSIAIPVYAFLLIPTGIALAGDFKRFLERTAKIQCGLLICVYCLSYAPALLTINKTFAEHQGKAAASQSSAKAAIGQPQPKTAPAQPSAENGQQNAKIALQGTSGLLFFFVLMVQLSDALQYAWSQLPSKHVIAPTINATRTWEGLLGGTVSVMLLGTALAWATPFSVWMSAVMSAVISLMGFAGSITMSAIKRDRGVRDYGTLVEGHGGVLDRIDSLCFAAPVFFHCIRWWFGG